MYILPTVRRRSITGFEMWGSGILISGEALVTGLI
jgi:hypothetical protein